MKGMEGIELVIKIPKAYYELVIKSCKDPVLLNAFKNSTPLPKGHGRLGDLDELEKEMDNGIRAGLMIEGYEEYQSINDMDDCLECVKYADTIIEADKAESEAAK